MSRNTHRSAGNGRDRRVTTTAVGLTAVAALLLSPLASDASPNPSKGESTTPRGTAVQGGGETGDAQGAETDAQEAAATKSSEESAAEEPNGAESGRDEEPAADEESAGDSSADAEATEGAEPADDGDPDTGESEPGSEPSGDSTAPAEDGSLGNNCDDSDLAPHAGFQDGNRCVSTAFGEVGDADTNPSLMIASAPRTVRADRPFTMRVSTRNLVRDRFLAAGSGGYYKESSFLTDDGLVRGHFHSACRMLSSRRTAPDPGPVPAFFVATEDGGGGATPDTVTVRVSGLPRGVAQCAVWAGDGSHRVPMMQRANQIPAFDVVRIRVR